MNGSDEWRLPNGAFHSPAETPWNSPPDPEEPVQPDDFCVPIFENQTYETTAKNARMCGKIVGLDRFFGVEKCVQKMCTGLPEKRAPPGRLVGLGLAFRQHM